PPNVTHRAPTPPTPPLSPYTTLFRSVNCHLYEYEPGFKFDAIVNLGVTEHLPGYKKSLEVYQKLLKPGGKMYLDASACREKYKRSEEHTSELQSRGHLVCRLLLEKKK